MMAAAEVGLLLGHRNFGLRPDARRSREHKEVGKTAANAPAPMSPIKGFPDKSKMRSCSAYGRISVSWTHSWSPQPNPRHSSLVSEPSDSVASEPEPSDSGAS